MSKKIKVTVKKEFTDRYTGLKRKKGEILTVSEERYREIKRSGDYVESVSGSKPETDSKPEKTNIEIKK